MVGDHDTSHGSAGERLPDREASVRFAFLHHAAHAGVHRQIQRLDQDLSLAGRRDVRVHNLEVFALRLAVRPPRELDYLLPVVGHGERGASA